MAIRNCKRPLIKTRPLKNPYYYYFILYMVECEEMRISRREIRVPADINALQRNREISEWHMCRAASIIIADRGNFANFQINHTHICVYISIYI